ncbi:hypothetical protein LR48_Vigan406s007000 [Vigna angularis]|uniref:30S ribosomal protein S15, chloroplastic n=2 Tax=Phaseolus angularis TaxID=3914 RepID=A0A0L9T9H1_PHAAN|nr:hypothetical protein LR48_Vigan406s007000 [Vigna angularis]
MALLLRLNRRRATSSRTLFFSTSNSDSNSDSNSPFSSLFIDVKESLKQPSSPSSNPRSQPPFANEILKDLSEFRAKTAPPPPGDPSQQQQQFSFQQIYQRQTVQGNPPRSGESSSPSMESIFGSLRNLSVAQTPVSQGRPRMIGGTNALPQAIFGKEMRKVVQGLSILNHLSGTPTFSLEPPKPHLVEKYFHPDNMSSAEKMKTELAKVRDEFKMSESDCGSARVQRCHSRKGLVAMVQMRKRLLKYLRRTDWDSYCFVISKLGLRDNPDHSYRSRTSMAT